MAEGKKKIIVYADWISTFEELKDAEAGRLIKHFFRYINDYDPEPPDKLTKIAFEPIKQTLKRDLAAWKKKSEKNSDNANKRWSKNANHATTSERIKTDANHADSDIVTDSVSDTVKVNDNVKRENNAPGRMPVVFRYEDFISDFNALTKRQYRGDVTSKRNFNARMKENYSREDFKKAIDNCMADRFHIENNLKYLTPEFILRPDKLQKFLNVSGNVVSTQTVQANSNPYWNYCPNTWDEAFYNRIKDENYAERKIAAYEAKLKKNGYQKQGNEWIKAA